MDYPLENLGDDSFQELCQALLVREFPNVQCFPIGQPDGGRDATSRSVEKGNGHSIVFQVKFVHRTDLDEFAHKKLLESMSKEVAKFKSAHLENSTHYTLLTNVRGTGHRDSGAIDKMNALLASALPVPATVWWRDDICRRLDSDWDLKMRFPQIMTGVDLVRLLVEWNDSGQRQEIKRVLSEILASQRDEQGDLRLQIESFVQLLDCDERDHFSHCGSETLPNLALTKYRGILAAEKDIIALSLFSPEVRKFHRKDLLSTFQLDQGESVIDALKLWKRFTIVGLPGSGKSQASRQLAAYLAADPVAPIPILFDFRTIELKPSNLKSQIMENLLAQTLGPLGQERHLVQELVKRTYSGNAVLIFDGLDECRGAVGTITDAISDLLTVVSPDTAIVVTTRESGQKAASKLGFPCVSLQAPKDFAETLRGILHHLAPPAEVEAGQWLERRLTILDSVIERNEQLSILRIPLVGILFTLSLAQQPSELTHGSVAELIESTIKNSLSLWEANKSEYLCFAEGGPARTTEMLFDTFLVIGRELCDRSMASLEAVQQAVSSMLKAAWDESTRSAQSQAKLFIEFWDQRMGIFVIDNKKVTSRSKVFVDYATAKLVTELHPPEKWETIGSLDSDTLRLAAGLDQATKIHLLEEARKGQRSSYIDALLDGHQLRIFQLEPDELTATLSVLTASFTSLPVENSPSSRPGLCDAVEKIVLCRTDRMEHFNLQKTMLCQLLGDKEQLIGQELLCVTHLTNGNISGQILNPELLEIALTDAVQLEKSSVRGISDRLLSRLIGWVAENLAPLSEPTIEKVTRIAARMGHGEVYRLEMRLKPRGLHVYQEHRTSSVDLSGIIEYYKNNKPWQSIIDFYTFLSTLADHEPSNTFQTWSFHNLFALTEYLRLAETGPTEPSFLVQHRAEETALIIRAAATQLGVSLNKVALLAHNAAQVLSNNETGESLGPFLGGPSNRACSWTFSPVDSATLRKLVKLFHSDSEWIYQNALRILKQTPPGAFEIPFHTSTIPSKRRADALELTMLQSRDGAAGKASD